jgi:hypothetical protein
MNLVGNRHRIMHICIGHTGRLVCRAENRMRSVMNWNRAVSCVPYAKMYMIYVDSMMCYDLSRSSSSS